MRCPACGHESSLADVAAQADEPVSRFCTHCGQPLAMPAAGALPGQAAGEGLFRPRNLILALVLLLFVFAGFTLWLVNGLGNTFRESAPAPVASTGTAAAPGQVETLAPGMRWAAPGSPEAGGDKSYRPGRVIYQESCASCHEGNGGAGEEGAPGIGDQNTWRRRLAGGDEALITSVLNSRERIPAHGGNGALKDEEVVRASDYLIARVRQTVRRVDAPQASDQANDEADAPLPPSAVKAGGPASAPETPADAPASHPAAPAAGQGDWLAGLRRELAECEQKGFFGRISCRESARWKYCAPNHWNTVAECKTNNAGGPPNR